MIPGAHLSIIFSLESWAPLQQSISPKGSSHGLGDMTGRGRDSLRSYWDDGRVPFCVTPSMRRRLTDDIPHQTVFIQQWTTVRHQLSLVPRFQIDTALFPRPEDQPVVLAQSLHLHPCGRSGSLGLSGLFFWRNFESQTNTFP